MSKAFDRVNWKFLIKTLQSFGFSEQWCNLIFQCISASSISVLLNGSPGKEFKPFRGIRQGDPLSPYLFILCMEVFSRILCHLETTKQVTDIKLTPKSPPISHLFFADDLLLFTKADLGSCKNLLEAVNLFSISSGKVINFNKSGLFFSKKDHSRHQGIICRMMKIKKINIKDTYLGVPLFVGRSKLKSFDNIIEKMEHRVKNWLAKVLSQSSKIVLDKSILSSMPMGCFVLSCLKRLLKESMTYRGIFDGVKIQTPKEFISRLLISFVNQSTREA